MTLRYVHSILAVAVLTCGVTVGVAYAQQRDGGLLPANQSGTVTVTGCLVRGDQIRGGDPDKFVLANPTAPIANAPAETCTAESGANAVQLDHPKKGPIDESMLGRWVQISGRLEKETSTDDILRELDVESASLVPVVVQRAEALPAPEPEPAPAVSEPSPAPVPVATSGVEPLPKTAGNGPALALFGLLALAGSLVLRAMPHASADR